MEPVSHYTWINLLYHRGKDSEEERVLGGLGWGAGEEERGLNSHGGLGTFTEGELSSWEWAGMMWTWG